MNDTTIASNFFQSSIKIFEDYRRLAERAMEQIADDKLFIAHGQTNSIAVQVKHLSGNMLSRWTDFLTSDGEKTWRNRDNEFVGDYQNRTEMMEAWDKGWTCLLNTLKKLKPNDLEKKVFIRNEGHTVIEAVHRQMAHYSYHVGQIVHIAKELAGEHWQTLSIPKGGSKAFNKEKFSKPMV